MCSETENPADFFTHQCYNIDIRYKSELRESRVNSYKTINDVLVHLFNEIWKLEEKAIITEEFKDITNNDMHIIEAIGLGEGDTMSSIAKKLNVTAGTLTTSMNRLVRQNYVERQRGNKDRRVVMIHLTEKGERAYKHHSNFHAQMTNAVIQSLDPDELPVLLKTLDGLSSFFRNYHE